MPPRNAPTSPTASPSIVFADNDALVLEAIGDLLRSKGYDVHAVEDGLAAWERIRAIRPTYVILDVVMNHARECPLAQLAWSRHFINRREEPGRGDDYGGQIFRYRDPVDGRHWTRLLHFDMARYWIEEYHVDGFRIDEFKGIDNWEFIQQFRDHAWGAFRTRFSDRPFAVIAEDSWPRTVIVRGDAGNPNGRKVVDAMWNFSYRDDCLTS